MGYERMTDRIAVRTDPAAHAVLLSSKTYDVFRGWPEAWVDLELARRDAVERTGRSRESVGRSIAQLHTLGLIERRDVRNRDPWRESSSITRRSPRAAREVPE
jgi:hypothetical protein